jgi:hypothetical protein
MVVSTMLTINSQATVAAVLFWLARRIPIRKNIKTGTAINRSKMLNDIIDKLVSDYKLFKACCITTVAVAKV